MADDQISPFDQALADLQRRLDGGEDPEARAFADRQSIDPPAWRQYLPSNKMLEGMANGLLDLTPTQREAAKSTSKSVNDFLFQPHLSKEYKQHAIDGIGPMKGLGGLADATYETGKRMVEGGIEAAGSWFGSSHQYQGAKLTDELVIPQIRDLPDAFGNPQMGSLEDGLANDRGVKVGPHTAAPFGLAAVNPLGMLRSGAARTLPGGLLANGMKDDVQGIGSAAVRGEKVTPANAQEPTIKGYHGSPRDFDEFVTPAFFDEHEYGARTYRKEGGGGDNLNGLGGFSTPKGWYHAHEALDKAGPDLAKAVALLEQQIKEFSPEHLAPHYRHYLKRSPLDVLMGRPGQLEPQFREWALGRVADKQAGIDYLQSGAPLGKIYEAELQRPTAHYHGDQEADIADAIAKGHKVITWGDERGPSPGDEIIALDKGAIRIQRKLLADNAKASAPGLFASAAAERRGDRSIDAASSKPALNRIDPLAQEMFATSGQNAADAIGTARAMITTAERAGNTDVAERYRRALVDLERAADWPKQKLVPAVSVDGKVFAGGPTHADSMQKWLDAQNSSPDVAELYRSGRLVDGYVAADGKFLNRQEAADFAGSTRTDLGLESSAARRQGILYDQQGRGDRSGDPASDPAALKQIYARQGMPVPVNQPEGQGTMDQGTDPFDAELADLAERLGMGEQGNADPRMARSSMDSDRMSAVMAGLIGPNEELTPEVMARLPKKTEGKAGYPWPLSFLNDPVGHAMSGVEGMPIGRGLMGAPGAIQSAATNALAGVSKPAMAGGAGLAATMAGTNEASPTDTAPPLQKLLEQQATLQAQAEAARRQREAQRPRGRAPSPDVDTQFTAADAEYTRLSGQLTAVGKMIEQEQTLNSPAFQLKMEQERAKVEEEKKAREASTPFRERYPGVAGAMPAVGIALSAGIPFALKAKGNLSSFTPGSPAGQMRTAVAEAEAARASGNAATLELRKKEIADLLANRPQANPLAYRMATSVAKGGSAALAGGALVAEANLLPDQIDAFNLPDGPAQDKARERATNLLNYLERGAVGTLTGLSGYKAGGLVPERGSPVSRGRAIAGIEGSDPPGAMATIGGWFRSLAGREGPQGPVATTGGPAAGNLSEVNALSPKPTAGMGSVEKNALEGRASTERQLSGPDGRASDLPHWAGEPPPGIKLRPGQIWDKNENRVRERGQFAETPKYSVPRTKRNNLDPEE